MSQITPKRIALLLGQELGYCRGVLAGVLSFAESRRLPWIYHDAAPELSVLPILKRWKPDGIIALMADPQLARRLVRLRVPLVSTTHTLTKPVVPTIDVDNQAVGAEAAAYFLQRGYRNFGYYGSPKAQFSRDRFQGFADAVGQMGSRVSWCRAEFLPGSNLIEDWISMEKQTKRWLGKLPSKTAVLASNDASARMLAGICHQLNLQVPQTIAIMGVDNDTSECRMASPPLSSIPTPAGKIGEEAAALLLKLMLGQKSPGKPVYLKPLGVTERSSTNYSATENEQLRRTMDYLQQHANSSLSVNDVCSHVGMSRRSLERLFFGEFQSTIHHEILAARISLARQLLVQSHLSIAAIAEKSGFSSLRHLDRVFRKQVGMTPREFQACRSISQSS